MLALCTLFAVRVPVAEAGRVWSSMVDGWHIGAMADDRTGVFTGCVALKPYSSAFLALDLTADLGWGLVFQSAVLKVRKGQKLYLAMQVDNGPKMEVAAHVGPKGAVTVALGRNPPLLESLKTGAALQLHMKGSVVSYPLRSVDPVVHTLQDCHRRYRQGAG